MSSPTIESLPFEILDLIISFIPVVDYYNIKLTGSRHLTSAIRRRTSSISRQEYTTLLQQQDGYGSVKIVPIRTALTITIHRGSESIVRRYIDRYGGPKPDHSAVKTGHIPLPSICRHITVLQISSASL